MQLNLVWMHARAILVGKWVNEYVLIIETLILWTMLNESNEFSGH